MRYPNREELIRMGLAAFAVYLGIYYWQSISHALVLALSALYPVLAGCAIAYIANIPMAFFERRLAWMDANARLAKFRRPICLLGGLVIVVAATGFLVRFIAPELMQSVRMMSTKIPAMVQNLRALFREIDLGTLVDEQLASISNWSSIQQQLSNYFMSGTGGFMGSVLSRVSSVLSSTFEVFMSAILAIYLLMGKEKLAGQVSRLAETYLGRDVSGRLFYIARVFDRSFHNFIVGRCLVSLLLGVMCFGGMLLFKFPYAMTISTVVGVTYIVPVVGGYVGGIIGALLIFSISPMKAVGFVIFVLILEQFEANVIFPHIVGSSIGLPGIWVLAAVAVGGGLGGIPVVLLSVPVAASIYQLLGDDMRARRAREERAAGPEDEEVPGDALTAALAAEAVSQQDDEQPEA